MSSKRLIAIIVLSLLGTFGAAITSVAALSAPAAPFGGCGSDCSNGQLCYNQKCPCITENNRSICESTP